MTFPRIAAAAACGLALAAATLQAHAAPTARWTIVDLNPPAAAGSFGKAINNRGDVILDGTFVHAGDATKHVLVWQSGSLVDLGLPPQAMYMVGWNVNDRGAVIATAGTSNGVVSYTWQDGAWSKLPFSGTPTGINRFGDMAGSYVYPGSRFAHAFVYADGVFTDIGSFGGDGAVARRINDHGDVVGGAAVAGGGGHAFMYRDGVMSDLGVLGDGGHSNANDVNNHGQAVGYCDIPAENFRGVACVFERGMPPRPLFDLPGLHEAIAINDHGDVVGDFFNGKSFLYQDGVLTRLEEIPAVRDAGWVSLAPADINDRGWIVGTGFRAGDSAPHAFALIPK